MAGARWLRSLGPSAPGRRRQPTRGLNVRVRQSIWVAQKYSRRLSAAARDISTVIHPKLASVPSPEALQGSLDSGSGKCIVRSGETVHASREAPHGGKPTHQRRVEQLRGHYHVLRLLYPVNREYADVRFRNHATPAVVSWIVSPTASVSATTPVATNETRP